MKNHFQSQDICVLTPTKDRPHKIVNLLNSLVEQTRKVGRIIIVGSGENIESLVLGYSDRLPIEYYHSEIAGQIRQRKLGVSKLGDRTKLVATLDDDIILENNAIEKMIDFWNKKDERTAGVGFNITNITENKPNIIKNFFYIGASEPGKVLMSGIVTSITNVKENIKTEWLNGGATVWIQKIIIENIHSKNIDGKWAPCEDLIFSYPLNKRGTMFVCSDAKVIHDDILLTNNSFKDNFYKGKVSQYWLYYFVSLNSNLSKYKFILSSLIISFGGICFYLIQLKFNILGIYLGRLYGLLRLYFHIIRSRNIIDLIN